MASVCERNALGRLMCGVVLYVTSDLIHYEPTHRHGIALPRGTAGPIRVGVPVEWVGGSKGKGAGDARVGIGTPPSMH